MSPIETLHDAAEATREYAKGIDRATALRRLFAFWMAFTIVVSLVPPGVLYLGGPDVSPVGSASAEVYVLADLTRTESASISDAYDIYWSDDGTQAVIAEIDTEVELYSATEPFNVSTLSATGKNVSFASTRAVSMGDGGTKLYISGNQGDAIREYDLSTAWDPSTATLVNTFSTASSEPRGFDFSADGTKLYVADGNAEQIFEYTLSTPWDTTTASLTNTLSVSSQVSVFPNDVAIGGAGENLYVLASKTYRYELSTAYDITTASFSESSTLLSSQRIHLIDDGSRMYEGNNGGIIQNSFVDATVSGTVTFASNGTAVEGASITVNASSASDTTDASGAYSLALDNGTYEITATKGDFANSITVTVSGSDLTGQDIVLSSETLTLDVPTQMFPNETAAYEVTLEGTDVTDAANVTSSDPTNLTVNQTSNELEATSDVSFAGEITITAEHVGHAASRNVTVANLSASNVALMQNAADMTAAIWGDVQGPDGTRPGGTQLTMRVLFVALLIGAAIATHASGFAGIGGITLIVVMGWFMGWVSDGMALVTVFTGLFIGLNLAANIDYSVRK